MAVHEGEEDVGKKISGRNTPRRKETSERSVLVDEEVGQRRPWDGVGCSEGG